MGFDPERVKLSDPFRVEEFIITEPWALPTAINFIPCGDGRIYHILPKSNVQCPLSLIRKVLEFGRICFPKKFASFTLVRSSQDARLGRPRAVRLTLPDATHFFLMRGSASRRT